MQAQMQQAILDQGIACHQAGNIPEAEKAYRQVLSQTPNHPDALHLLGLIAHQVGAFRQALLYIEKAIGQRPEALFYFNLGMVYEALEDINAASTCWLQAIQLKSDYLEAYNKLLEHQPDYTEALFNRGNLLTRLERYPEAFRDFVTVIRLRPDCARAHCNLGTSIEQSGGDIRQAMQYYRKAIEFDPDMAVAYNNLGAIHQYRWETELAIAHYRKAIEINPEFVDAHFNLAMALLLENRYPEGWKSYEWRLKKGRWIKACPYRFEIPKWNGEAFKDKNLFVYAEQGMGDTIQFARYLPRVKKRGGTVTFQVAQPLVPLFQNFPGVDRVVAKPYAGDVNRDFDLWVPLLSLPRIFDTTLETIPGQMPYLQPPPKKVKLWADRFAGRDVKVGVVWAGNPVNRDDKYRSCDLKTFYPLFQVPGVRFYSLQKGKPADQLKAAPAFLPVTDLAPELRDFSDTAAVLEYLDLTIAVDTAIVHLAGAMGRPVWNIRTAAPYWVWIRDREDNPWYPTMRMFHQGEIGKWGPTIARVVQALQEFTDQSAGDFQQGMAV